MDLERIFYEDGTIGYSSSRNISMDKGVPEVTREKIRVSNFKHAVKTAERSRKEKGYRHSSGKWLVKEKTLQEQVDEGIITPKQAAELELEARRKDSKV